MGAQSRVIGPFHAGSLDFFIDTSSVEATDVTQAIFADLAGATPPAPRSVCYEVTESHGGVWTLDGPDVDGWTFNTLSALITVLVSRVNLAALDAESSRLHLHAACAVRSGRAVVMSAPRDTGKTTTVGRLACRGWEYISDEAVSIAGGDDRVRGFPKPLSIKPNGAALVPELEPHLLPASGDRGSEVLHVSIGAAGGTACLDAAPHVVALLKRSGTESTGTSATERRIHPADAVVALMSETMDAGRFGQKAVVELARLAARCHCHEVSMGSVDATTDLIEHLVAAAPVEPMPLRPLEDGEGIPSTVVSVLVGERAVIHEVASGTILALDPIATRIWLHLGQWQPSSDIDSDGPVVAPFVDQLVALGVVER